MKKPLLIFSSILAVIAAIAGGFYRAKQSEKEYMTDVVQSEEVKRIIETDLRNMLPDFLEKNSYEVDITSIKKHPMGGLQFRIIINNDKRLYVFYTLNRDRVTGNIVHEGGGNSAEFEKTHTGRAG